MNKVDMRFTLNSTHIDR